MYDFEHMDQRLIAYVNIFICANRLQAIMDSGLEDITAKQWLAITMIDAFPEPPTLKQISEMSGVTHQSMRQIVDRLIDKGFLEVVPDKKDKRAIRLVKTEAANNIRTMRANLLDEKRKTYVLAARARGLNETKMILQYPVRVALNPFISTIGSSFANLFSGSTVTAIVLSLPMCGPMLIEALQTQDMYLAGSFLFLLSIMTVIGTLISDILLAIVDPRIRYEKG